MKIKEDEKKNGHEEFKTKTNQEVKNSSMYLTRIRNTLIISNMCVRIEQVLHTT